MRAVGAWLDASPAEFVGLAVMVLGAVAVAAVAWWTARPVELADVASDGTVAAATDDDAAPSGAGDVTIHVAGAVLRPGLVIVPIGGRVADAVAAAGGPAADADLDPLNLARLLADGERIVVPVAGAVVGAASEGSDGTSVPGVHPDGRLDLNTASSTQLQDLPGIGPVLAERIVDHRDANGPFADVGELREVTGIGERTFQGLADLVAV